MCYHEKPGHPWRSFTLNVHRPQIVTVVLGLHRLTLRPPACSLLHWWPDKPSSVFETAGSSTAKTVCSLGCRRYTQLCLLVMLLDMTSLCYYVSVDWNPSLLQPEAASAKDSGNCGGASVHKNVFDPEIIKRWNLKYLLTNVVACSCNVHITVQHSVWLQQEQSLYFLMLKQKNTV